MNVIDWLSATADYLVADRPDIYDKALAVEELSSCMETLRDGNRSPVSTISFTSYLLTRIVEDDTEEFILSRKASTVCIFPSEETCLVYSHMTDVALPSIWDAGLDPDLDV